MSGMDMMLKSMLGVDPQELREQVQGLITQGQSRLEAVDKRLAQIESNIGMLYILLADAGVISTIEAYNEREAIKNGNVRSIARAN